VRRRAPEPDAPRDTARLTAALALVLSFSPSLLRRRRSDQVAVSLVASLLGAILGGLVEAGVRRLAALVPGGERTARGLFIAAGLAATAAELPREPAPAVSALGTAGRVAAIGALVGAVAPRRRRLGGVGLAATATALAIGGGYLRARRRRPGGPRLTAFPVDRFLDTVSGGEGSAAPRAGLDYEGSRFLACTTPAARIAGLTGAPALDPIRVFVGVGQAATPAERAELAIRELERLGAFERSRILVCSATLRGYVNPVAMAAVEVLAGGDVASVTVQYHDRRTLLMPLKVPVAAATHRALLEGLAHRLAAQGDGAPALLVYGESLGAWASQEVFGEEGVEALDRLHVARALWVGTPWFSRFVRGVRRHRIPVDERIGFLDTHEFLLGDPPAVEQLRFVFLWRPTDPVALFSGLSLIWHCPPWLTPVGRAARGIPANVRWIPVVTFVQVAVDVLRSTNWTGGRPQAIAHDYRLEVPLAVDIAFGLGASREQVETVATAILADDRERVERVRAARRAMTERRL
jgi:uncharacterized membrane protein